MKILASEKKADVQIILLRDKKLPTNLSKTEKEYKASYGIYVYCGIKRENGEIIVCIGESEDKTINYLAKNKVDDYNTQFNKKTYDYKNLNNDIDLIIDKIIENMQWFAKLPLNEIQDRNDLSKSNNKEIRNDGSEMSNKKENKIYLLELVSK